MRKPRDYDSDLKVLDEKALQLKERKPRQLSELVLATGADILPLGQLAGALLSAGESTDTAIKEVWRRRGAAFFQSPPRSTQGADKSERSNISGQGSAAPSLGEMRT